MVKQSSKTYPSVSLPGLGAVARDILGRCTSGRHVVTFSGPLGAGKSTLIRALGRRLGISRLPSPTYVLVRHAKPKQGGFERLVHVDLYRLPSGSSLVPLGLTEDLSDPSALVLIEWPERAKKLTPDVRVRLHGSGDRRTVRISSRSTRER